MLLASYVFIFAVGSIFARIDSLALQAGFPRTNGVVMPVLTIVAAIALVVFGFLTFRWFVVVGVFVGCAFMSGIIVRPTVMRALGRWVPLMEGFFIAGVALLWLLNWPF